MHSIADGTTLFTFILFEGVLRDLVADPINEELDIQQRFTDAKQRRDQDIHSFNAYLQQLEAQMPKRTEVDRRDAFLTRIAPSIRNIIRNQAILPLTRDEAVALAARIETNTRKSDVATSNDRVHHRIPERFPPRSTKKVYSGKSEAPQARSEKPRTDIRDSDPPKKKIECFNCHKIGHYANECRSEKKIPSRYPQANRVAEQAKNSVAA